MNETADQVENFSLSYLQMMELLYSMYRSVDDLQKLKIRSRFKNLQKVGLPSGERPARGKHQKYSFQQVCEIVCCFELAEFGLDPNHILNITQRVFLGEESSDGEKLAEILEKVSLGFHKGQVLYWFRLDLLSSLDRAVVYGSSSTENYMRGNHRRGGMLNISKISEDMLQNYPSR